MELDLGYIDGLGDAVEQGLVKAVGVSNYSGLFSDLTNIMCFSSRNFTGSLTGIFISLVSFIAPERRLRDAYNQLKKRGIPLASNQVNYSLIYRIPEENGVKATCDELGITLIAYSPIAQGMI